jgi:hypothetical protein
MKNEQHFHKLLVTYKCRACGCFCSEVIRYGVRGKHAAMSLALDGYRGYKTHECTGEPNGAIGIADFVKVEDAP